QGDGRNPSRAARGMLAASALRLRAQAGSGSALSLIGPSRLRRRGLHADATSRRRRSMEVLYPRCAGLDVHQEVIVAAVRCVSQPQHHEVRSFATTTSGLVSLSEWLRSHQCTHVAMEATGIYCKPVSHVLEG